MKQTLLKVILLVTITLSMSSCKVERKVNNLLRGNNTCPVAGCTTKAPPCTWDIVAGKCR